MTASYLALLEDHVLVLGYGNLTEPLLEELSSTTDPVVVTPDADAASGLRDRDVNVLTAEPTAKAALRDARADSAAGVVAATDDHARNTLALLAARQVNPDLRVVTAANDQRHVDKLEDVGADTVGSPSIFGGRLLGRSVLDDRPRSVDLDGERTAAADDADPSG